MEHEGVFPVSVSWFYFLVASLSDMSVWKNRTCGPLELFGAEPQCISLETANIHFQFILH